MRSTPNWSERAAMVSGEPISMESTRQEPRVRISHSAWSVCPPQITKDSVLRGPDELEDETEERLNAALWQYSERVATLIEEALDEFIRQTQA